MLSQINQRRPFMTLPQFMCHRLTKKGACLSIAERFFLPKCVDPRRTLRAANAVFLKVRCLQRGIDHCTAQPIIKCLFNMLHKKKKHISYHVISDYEETSLATGGLVNCEKEYR